MIGQNHRRGNGRGIPLYGALCSTAVSLFLLSCYRPPAKQTCSEFLDASNRRGTAFQARVTTYKDKLRTMPLKGRWKLVPEGIALYKERIAYLDERYTQSNREQTSCSDHEWGTLIEVMKAERDISQGLIERLPKTFSGRKARANKLPLDSQ